MYSVQHTYNMYNLHYTKYIIQCTLYNVHYPLYMMQCILYKVYYTIYMMQCTLYNVHYPGCNPNVIKNSELVCKYKPQLNEL